MVLAKIKTRDLLKSGTVRLIIAAWLAWCVALAQSSSNTIRFGTVKFDNLPPAATKRGEVYVVDDVDAGCTRSGGSIRALFRSNGRHWTLLACNVSLLPAGANSESAADIVSIGHPGINDTEIALERQEPLAATTSNPTAVLLYQSTDVIARNDYTGSVGYVFSVANPITVTSLGRRYVNGNTGNHVVNLWDVSDQTKPMASGMVLASAVSDLNGYKWTDIPARTLAAGNLYVITVDEAAGGDTWANSWNPTGTGSLNNMFTIWNEVYGDASVYPLNTSAAGMAYSTPNLRFSYQLPSLYVGSPLVFTALDQTTDMLQFYRWDQTTGGLGAAIGPYGEYRTNAWMTVGGWWNQNPPTNKPYMLGVRSTIPGPSVVVKTNGFSGSALFLGIDQNGVNVFGVGSDGGINAGGGAPSNMLCWKADGRTLGRCSTLPDANGSCSCN